MQLFILLHIEQHSVDYTGYDFATYLFQLYWFPDLHFSAIEAHFDCGDEKLLRISPSIFESTKYIVSSNSTQQPCPVSCSLKNIDNLLILKYPEFEIDCDAWNNGVKIG